MLLSEKINRIESVQRIHSIRLCNAGFGILYSYADKICHNKNSMDYNPEGVLVYAYYEDIETCITSEYLRMVKGFDRLKGGERIIDTKKHFDQSTEAKSKRREAFLNHINK